MPRTDLKLERVLLLVSGLTLAYLTAPYLLIEELWFDASGQFFTSLGISNYAEPFSAPGSLIDMWELNQTSNLDPGGFTFLLRYWSLISTHPFWLRILPFSFVIIASLLTFKTSYLFSKNYLLAFLGSSLIFADPQLFHWSFSLRAYAMEVLAIGYLSYLLFNLNNSRLIPKLLILGLLLTSRYSSLVFLPCWGLAHFFQNRKSAVKDLSKIILTIVPFLILAGIQLSSHLKGETNYINDSLFAGKDLMEILSLLKQNFLTVPFLLQITFWITAINHHKKHRELATLAIFSTSAYLLFISLSFLGLYPWLMTERFNIGLNALSIICFSYGINLFFPRLSYKTFIPVMALIFSAIRLNHFTPFTNINSVLEEVIKSPEKRVFLGKYSTPEARFAFEHGTYKSYKNYPKQFTNEYQVPIKDLNLKEIDFIIVNSYDKELAKVVESRSDFKLVGTKKLHTNLYKRN